MNRIDCNYPYPVLINGGSDYKDCYFNLKVYNSLKKQANSLNITLEYELNSNGIRNLIEENKADVFVQVISKLTSYRKIYRFSGKSQLSINVDATFISKEITFVPFIALLEDIDGFTLEEHNDIFNGIIFNLKKGDQIAFADSLSYDLPTVDPLKPMSSIVRVKLDPSKSAAPYALDTTNEKLIILLNEKTFYLYRDLRQNSDISVFLSSMIMIPAMTEAISALRDDNDVDGCRSKKWGTILLAILDKKGIDLNTTDKSLITIANDIFNDGLTFAFTNLSNFYNTETKQGDEL